MINGGHITRYFSLHKGTRQGDHISPYLLALDVLFPDETTFFVKNVNSAKKVLSNLKLYSNVSGLYPNLKKCEIAGIGVLKKVNVPLCGMKSVNLMEYSIKILGIHISYNNKLQDKLNF